MKRVIAAVLVLLALAYPASHGRADEVPRSLSFNASAGGFSFAKEDQLRGQPVFDIRVGWDIVGTSVMDSLSIEGGLSYVSTQSTIDNDPVDAYLLRVDALYPFFPRGRVVPFLTIGAGSMIINRSSSLEKMPVLAYGAGMKYFIQDFVAFRVDVRQNMLFDITTRSNLQYMVGFSFLIDRDKKLTRLPKPPPTREVKSKSSIRPLNIVEPEQDKTTTPVPPAEPEQTKQSEPVKESSQKQPALPLAVAAPAAPAAQTLIDDSAKDEEDEEDDFPSTKPEPAQKRKQPEQAQSEWPRPEAVQPELPQPELPQPELPQPELPQPELPQPELPQPELQQPELPEPELPEPELPQPEWSSQPKLPEPELHQPGLVQLSPPKDIPARKLYIKGHADNSGSPEPDVKLSRKSAENTKKSLKKKLGRAKGKTVTTAALGSGTPLDNNKDSAGRKNNRRSRVEVKKTPA